MSTEAPTRLSYSCPDCRHVPQDYALTCSGCGCDLLTNDPRSPEALASSINRKDRSIFFYVTPLKLYLMYLATFGVYGFFWAYKNWSYVKEHTGRDFRDGLRAVFYPLTYYFLLKEIRRAGAVQGKEFSAPIGLIALGYLLCAPVFSALPVDIPFLNLFISPLLFLPAQNFINELNEGGSEPINAKFSPVNIIGLVLGLALLGKQVLRGILGYPH